MNRRKKLEPKIYSHIKNHHMTDYQYTCNIYNNNKNIREKPMHIKLNIKSSIERNSDKHKCDGIEKPSKNQQ